MPTEFVSEEQRARTMVARLELVSHGTIAKIGGQVGPKSDDGPVFPPGGIMRKDDREEGGLKSHTHFAVRLEACRSEPEYGTLADEVEAALRAWQRAKRPPKDSEAWRELVGKDKRPAKAVAAEWDISASYVYQLREQVKRAAA